MISVSQLTKTYGEHILFENVTITFSPGRCYGIVGANGSGKSTFLKILTAEEDYSTGERIVANTCRLGFLRQDRFRSLEQSILDVAMMGDEVVYQALHQRDALLAESEKNDTFDSDAYSKVEDIILQHDGYTLESRAGEILEGLGIPSSKHHQPMSTLSGGFQLRVLMAQSLAARPDALLLDEPTNHLDIVSIRWLEGFIKDFRGTVVVVSHDQFFLDSVCTHILDVDYDTIIEYPGNYTAFTNQKVEERTRREKQISKQEKQIAHQQAFVDRFKAKATKARQAQSKKKQLDKIVVEKLPTSSRRHPRLNFQQTRASGRDVLKIEELDKAYGDHVVLKNVDISLRRGDRLAIIGPNGIGKSTLLKILASKLEPDSGEFTWGHEVNLGYFPQDHRDLLTSPKDSVLQYVWEARPGDTTSEVRGILGRALFSGDDVDKKIRQLSGGEAARLIFARLMADRPNVMLLDEPTNHLDLESIDNLCDAVLGYEGTTLFVSHDRHVVSKLATRILELKEDGIHVYNGTYEEYLGHLGEDHLNTDVAISQNKKPVKEKSPLPTRDKAIKKEKKPGRQKLTRELEKTTLRIEIIEHELEEIHATWAQSDFYMSHSDKEIKELEQHAETLQKELAERMAQWEQLEEDLEGAV
ncbi:MAG: ABC-F family ATP-binding cassette domain-containing protein [Deltaproteobacteria bacterium]|jgi:ATPase subunit of ABC transporter with duplicated ATPase domains|nr:ABC-F family ATP-binding cassette domain-containing protein [Deltaproteobacteria bacterium]MBT6434589.1 ABC-F family ATP-binding cassette domain-containing protein [Deltaproteobacteria bacterium]